MTREKAGKVLLNKALRCLNEVVPVGKTTIKWQGGANDFLVLDAFVHFAELLGEHQIEIRQQITHKAIGAIQLLMERATQPCILVMKYVTPQMGEELRRRNIQFLDTVGNMFIKQERPFVFVFNVGKKDLTKTKSNRPVLLFREAGLRVLFVLLGNPEAVRMPYREIADKAGVALGTVSNVFADLKRLRFIHTIPTGRTIERREDLVDAWIEAYPNELRPKLNPRRFTVKNNEWWRTTVITKFDAFLGGEPAAALLTGYLHPEIVTVYVGKHFAEFARKLRLRKDEQGNLLVLDKFWSDVPPPPQNTTLAPPLLIYADLLAADGARNLETAQMIRRQCDV